LAETASVPPFDPVGRYERRWFWVVALVVAFLFVVIKK